MSTLATSTVLNIPELLEAILLGTDIRILLVSAQRVCKQWTAVILSSSRLQKKLFFAGDESSAKTCNPLLEWCFPFCFDSQTRFPGRSIFWISGSHGVATQPLRWLTGEEVCFLLLNKEAFSRPEASWRRMLIQQPPVRHIQQIFTQLYHEDPQGQYIRIDTYLGVRMAAMLDAVFALNRTKAQGMVGGLHDAEARPAAMRVIWHHTPFDGQSPGILKFITDHDLAPGIVIQHVIDGAYDDCPNRAFAALRKILTGRSTYVGGKVHTTSIMVSCPS